jgi:hypothetical protein
MRELQAHIQKQLLSTKDRNLFHGNTINTFRFIDGTREILKSLKTLDEEEQKSLIEYACNSAIEEFCRINQYYSFKEDSKEELRYIYRDLFHRFCMSDSEESCEAIAKDHCVNLQNWLEASNPFARQIYAVKEEDIEAVYCAEYSPNLQIQLLDIDFHSLPEPVLDIGCGKDQNLVNYLRYNAVEAYGIDRFEISSETYTCADWLEYDYGKEKWGTMISHLAFTNHFKHHHLRSDGDYIAYAKKYMMILEALKIGGSFYYVPAIPFIEEFLPHDKYTKKTIPVPGSEYEVSIITRVK